MKINLTSTRGRALCAGLSALFLLGSAQAANVGADLPRRRQNAACLAKMHPYMRPKIQAVLSDLENHSLKPMIDQNVWRSEAQQRDMVRRGASHVYYSFHNVTDTRPDGTRVPASLAADIVDYHSQWNAPRSFWLLLASSAQNHNCESGIMLGLNPRQRLRVQSAIVNRQWEAPVPLGWDTAHVQPQGISLVGAKRGVRPKKPPQ